MRLIPDTLGSRLTTRDGRQALSLVSDGPYAFDILITDQSMPGLIGVELIAEIKKQQPELPVILCTGHSDIVGEANAARFGVDCFLKKPIGAGELIEAVRKLLALHPDAPS